LKGGRYNLRDQPTKLSMLREQGCNRIEPGRAVMKLLHCKRQRLENQNKRVIEQMITSSCGQEEMRHPNSPFPSDETIWGFTMFSKGIYSASHGVDPVGTGKTTLGRKI